MLQTTTELPILLNQKKTAEYLGVSIKTLEKMRLNGTGPKYIKIGRAVRYRGDHLLDHVNTHTFASTAEAGQGA